MLSNGRTNTKVLWTPGRRVAHPIWILLSREDRQSITSSADAAGRTPGVPVRFLIRDHHRKLHAVAVVFHGATVDRHDETSRHTHDGTTDRTEDDMLGRLVGLRRGRLDCVAGDDSSLTFYENAVSNRPTSRGLTQFSSTNCFGRQQTAECKPHRRRLRGVLR
jgi:hypothetical protein